jgi:DUF971 family protein
MSIEQTIPSDATPVLIKRITEEDSRGYSIGIGISIRWSSGNQCTIDSQILRQNCPCATCLEENRFKQPHDAQSGRSRLKVISADAETECDLMQILPVGNYAINLLWKDKHDTGIYPFDTLRELCNLHKKSQQLSQSN